ncbi:hypothetical protein BASA81_001808 [Batrachochytrium salamandrivorans]|nr:hypothetical protein BASA81_001808 [Batrachochytrium salamandrivorans]
MSSASLTASQRAKTDQVMQFTTCGLRQAHQVLAANHWNVEDGIEYEAPPKPTSLKTTAATTTTTTAVSSQLNELFNSYAKLDTESTGSGLEEDARMGINSLVQFFADIGVDDPENDPVVLLLALKMQAKEMLTYTRQEFTTGMQRLQCTSAEQLNLALPTWRHELDHNDKLFWEVYAYSFSYGLVPGQKVLTKDTALALWGVLLTPQRFALLPQFLDYFQRHVKHGVNKDLWQQFSALVLLYRQHSNSFVQEFSKIASWPLVFDEFVDTLK